MHTVLSTFFWILAVQADTAHAGEFTVHKTVNPVVSLDDVRRIYHFGTCPGFNPSGIHAIPAVATLRGYAADPNCAASGAVREWRTVKVRQAARLMTRTNVLFVGNSLTYFNDLPGLVEELSQTAGRSRPIRAAFVGSGGLTLEQQWERGDALERIYADSWDFVVLQEQSGRPVLAPDRMATYVKRFDEAIRASGARTVLFMPWPTISLRAAQPSVNARFKSLAASSDVLLAPVGTVWSNAQQRRSSIALYDAGGNHPTLAGSYLAACVIYSTLRNQSAEGLPHAFAQSHASDPTDRLTAEQAAFLQQIAWQNVSAAR